MHNDKLEHTDRTSLGEKFDEAKQASPGSQALGKRAELRTELLTQAFVSIPPMNSRAFRITEVSRSGMFLAFIDATTTLQEIERESVEKGTCVEVAFAVPGEGERHRVSVRARIARITRKGLGLEFITRNPPQLAPLRDMFASAETRTPEVNRHSGQAPGKRQKSRVIEKPSDHSGWLDWELLD